MDTISTHPTKGMKKKNSSKNNIKIEKLKLEMKELELENEILRENNIKLRVQNIQISKQAYKWYKRNITFKRKSKIKGLSYSSG